jgi:hypothetical protein
MDVGWLPGKYINFINAGIMNAGMQNAGMQDAGCRNAGCKFRHFAISPFRYFLTFTEFPNFADLNQINTCLP